MNALVRKWEAETAKRISMTLSLCIYCSLLQIFGPKKKVCQTSKFSLTNINFSDLFTTKRILSREEISCAE